MATRRGCIFTCLGGASDSFTVICQNGERVVPRHPGQRCYDACQRQSVALPGALAAGRESFRQPPQNIKSQRGLRSDVAIAGSRLPQEILLRLAHSFNQLLRGDLGGGELKLKGAATVNYVTINQSQCDSGI